MEGYEGKDEKCLELLDLIPSKTDRVEKREAKSYGVSEEEKLELRLGPPDSSQTRKRDVSVVSFGYSSGADRRFLESVNGGQVQNFSSFLQLQSAQPGCIKEGAGLQVSEKEAVSPTSAANTASSVPNIFQQRTAPSSVVGWPPIRSLRKNCASSSFLKPSSESQKVVQNKVARENPVESSQKGLFVKINMDGVPIGRKVDLKSCDSYKKLSSAVDELFRGLLAAQNGTSVAENGFASLLDARGEYALVYEDNEGDRKLVRDVQWHVFVSTVKRLRVLKSSELSTLNGRKQMKL